MRQRLRQSAAIVAASIAAGRLLHSLIVASPASVGLSNAISRRRHGAGLALMKGPHFDGLLAQRR